MKKGLLIGCGALLALVLVIVVVAVVGGFLGTQGVASAGDDFMTALKDGDYVAAFDACAPALQEQLGSIAQLEQMIVEGRARPSDWGFNSRNASGGEGTLEGNVTMVDDVKGVVTLNLVKIDGGWRIIGFNLAPN